ncbi:hypothetical protein Rhopal_001759-T1 [Rhodotorula paludigena]|uniref:Ran GTPase-activating protein 1 n=1 Tax=Rhodotorula paludigena TaxID=86838 RepID=A0AAV5G8G1_9BASI|nr:hypothetical protein Rhopal_001759-T1 [Rhodotorula paludigena]
MASPDRATLYSLVGRQLKLDSLDQTQPFLDEIAQVDGLDEVRFGGNTLGVDACEGVARALEKKHSLRVADFSDIFTGRLISEIPQSLRFLCTSLLSLPNLTSLDLSDNAFGGRSAEPMLEFIGNAPALEVLKLNNNGMGPAGGAMIAGALLENAKKAEREGRKSNLRVLVCGRNRLENGSSQAFSDAFAALGTLREVRMPQNGIRMEGIELLAQGLQKNPDLEWLDLQDNTATEKGSRAIAKSLPSWPKLRVLNLSDCLLRPRGGLSIFRTLSTGSNPHLSSLKLQSNELDARAVTELARAIAAHGQELAELELNGNYGDDGTEEQFEKVREALDKWGNGDALDELDELEEPEEDEDEDEDDDEEAEEEAGESDAEKEGAPHKESADEKKESDDLAGLMDKVHIA